MDVSEIFPLVSGLFNISRERYRKKILTDAQSAKKKNEFSD